MRALLEAKADNITKEEKLATAGAISLGFDSYARGGDMVWTKKEELRPPVLGVMGAQHWTLTMWPSTAAETSKTNTQDATKRIAIAETRVWVAELCPLLLRSSPNDPRLIPPTQERYVTLFHPTFSLAGLPPCTPHPLRHGGASADGMLNNSDVEILPRGDWRCMSSIQGYRWPAGYLRQLSALTPYQLSRARASPPAIIKLARTCMGRGRPSGIFV